MTATYRRSWRALGYGLYVLLDHGCWVMIKLLPGPQVMAMARQRPWRRLQLSLSASSRERWLHRIVWLLRTRCRRASWGSTCLSRSLSGRLLLDWIGVPNDLHLGMSKFPDHRKVPHAWLRDPISGRLFTPGLTPGTGAPLIQL